MNEYYWEAVVDGIVQANSKEEAYNLLNNNKEDCILNSIKYTEFVISEEHVRISICKEREENSTVSNNRMGDRRDKSSLGRRVDGNRRKMSQARRKIIERRES